MHTSSVVRYLNLYHHVPGFKRYYSYKFPDNAPTASDNQLWLEHLNQIEKSKNLKDLNPESEKRKSPIYQDIDAKFPVTIESFPPQSEYIEIKAALANFTSINYLQSSKKNSQTGFVDVRIVKCKSGAGGNGTVSFFRDAGRSIGPPDGGDGGDGGSIYIQAVEGLNSLSKLRTTYIAKEGLAGGPSQLDGPRGKDVLITVPVGTVVRWCMDPLEVRNYVKEQMKVDKDASLRSILDNNKISLQCTGKYKMDRFPENIQLFRDSYKMGEGWVFKDKTEEYHNKQEWFNSLNKRIKVYDLSIYESELENDRFPLYGIDLRTATEKPICLLKGGKGGLGNMHFLTQLIRNPRFAKEGRKGLEQYLLFELKTIADLGLVGFPNAGKSTILNRISNAKPRIGHWEFTTLTPTIGTISLGIGEQSFTVADIPGIIEDASLDKGMGLEFLRHIERSKGWVFVLSLEDKDPLATLDVLVKELGGIEKVQTKNILVVCNKADINATDHVPVGKYMKIQGFCNQNNWDCLPISALNNENIDMLIEKMANCAKKIK